MYTEAQMYLMILVSFAIITVPGVVAFAFWWRSDRKITEFERRRKLDERRKRIERQGEAA